MPSRVARFTPELSGGALRIQQVDRALITEHELSDIEMHYRGAVYDARGELVRDSLRAIDRLDNWRSGVPERVERPVDIVGSYLGPGHNAFLDRGVFGGFVFGGWGHLITESLATAWATEGTRSSDPLVMLPWGRVWTSYVARAREVFELAGWGSRPLLISTGDMVVNELVVPQPAFELDAVLYEEAPIAPQMNVVYDRMREGAAESDMVRGELVFLPRPVGHRRRHAAEGEIEEALVSAGFVVVRGWEMDVKDQIAALTEARVVVGFSGSNLHNSVFAPRSGVCIEIEDERARKRRLVAGRMLQEPLCDLRSQSFHNIESETGGVARSAREILRDVAEAMRGA